MFINNTKVPFDRKTFLRNICNSQSSSFLVDNDYKQSSNQHGITQCRNRDYNVFGHTKKISF